MLCNIIIKKQNIIIKINTFQLFTNCNIIKKLCFRYFKKKQACAHAQIIFGNALAVLHYSTNLTFEIKFYTGSRRHFLITQIMQTLAAAKSNSTTVGVQLQRQR